MPDYETLLGYWGRHKAGQFTHEGVRYEVVMRNGKPLFIPRGGSGIAPQYSDSSVTPTKKKATRRGKSSEARGSGDNPAEPGES